MSLLDRAVTEFAKLPGIGPRTALRLVLYQLRQSEEEVQTFADAVATLRRDVRYCKVCHNISDTDICPICSNPKRDRTTICVVENIRDVMAIEDTGQYHGLYHVLGGLISPVDGIGPADIEIASLVSRVEEAQNGEEPIKEVILALSSTMEGDTTAFFIVRRLKATGVKLTAIARGIPVGDSLEYADELTLGKSIAARTAMS